MDYSKLKKEILIALRGSFSQKEMSQQLGFSFNQYHKWETDLKWLRWDEFIHILKTLHSPYLEAFEKVLAFQGNPKNMSELFNVLFANHSLKEISQAVGHNEDVIRRWIKKDIAPSVETLFYLIQLRTNNLQAFVSELVDIQQIPTFNSSFSQLSTRKEIEAKYPFASALEACLNLDEYKHLTIHSDQWISNRILVSEILVKKAIQELININALVLKDNKYELLENWVQINGLKTDQAAKIDQYWTQRAVDRYSGPTGVPWTPLEEPNNILRKTSQEILETIKKDKAPKSKVGVYVSHFFDAQDVHWSETKIV